MFLIDCCSCTVDHCFFFKQKTAYERRIIDWSSDVCSSDLAIATMCRQLGMGEEYPLPVASQRYGTVPDTAWKQRKYHTGWNTYDTVNATIGQGYMQNGRATCRESVCQYV